MKKHLQAYGYYCITLSAEGPAPLMRSNSERAFIIAQLQYFLSPRLILGEIPAYRQLASCIDLLAFSIKTNAVHLLIFSIDPTVSRYFTRCLTDQLSQYQTEVNPAFSHTYTVRSSIEKLAGAHEALAQSLAIHLLHEDWEYDRYSSIGFYLHDRRGDWMRTWRLARLYNNECELYRNLIHSHLYRTTVTPTAPSADAQYLAQEAHG